MQVETVRVSRRTLYDLIWSDGVVAAAAHYHLSDNGLRKVCLKHRIPLPPRGYRQKLKAGKNVTAISLPTLLNEQDIVFEVAPKPGDEGTGAAMFQPASDAESISPPVIVAQRLTRPHPATEALKAALGGMPDRDGYVRSAGPGAFLTRVHTSSVSRVLRIADAMAKACEARGFELRSGKENTSWGAQLQIVIDGFGIALSFNERARMTPFRLSPAEIARQQRGQYVYSPATQLEASGELALKLAPVWGTRLQGNWSDSKTRKLEERLDEVMLGLRRLAIWRRAERVKDDARQAKCDAENARRAALRKGVEDERCAIRQLEGDAASWRRAEDIRGYAAARAAAGDPASDPALGEWLAWACSQADRINPLCETPSILDMPEVEMQPVSTWQFARDN